VSTPAYSAATIVRERRVSGAGVELAVAERGDASRPSVLLVHGYPDTKEVWSEVATRLSGRFHVVAFDVRGAGASSAPQHTADYDLERLADDIVAVIDAVAPGKPVHLVGHDWGSIQSWELVTSARAEGKLASFTSMSGPSLDHVGHRLRDRLRRPTPLNLLTLAGQARRSWYMLPLIVSPRLVWSLIARGRWQQARRRLEAIPPDRARPAPTLVADGVHGAGLYRRNVGRRLMRPRAGVTARVPVRLIVATRDRYVSPRIFEGLERWVPMLERRDVEGPHWLPLTDPDRVAELISEFVDSLEAAR
jgi:pimeloyl-ACP methyl ester carboxylesterase